MLNCVHASAAVVGDLYETRVHVSSQTAAAQNAAFRASMEQVLVKVSGSREIAKDARLRSELAKARNYIQSFSFAFENETRLMLASFDETRINQLLSQFQFPIWGKRRPDTLLWMVVKDKDGTRELLTTNSESLIKKDVDTLTNMRGIVVDFPLMDIKDAENINVFDVWGRFDDTIKTASERYVTDNVVAARVYPRRTLMEKQEEFPENMSWQIDWQLLNADLTEEGTFFATDATGAILQFTDFMADRLASEYAFSSESFDLEAGTVTLKIINLESIESYVLVKRFFESLAMVSNARLKNLSGSVGTFELALNGATADLLNTLQLDDKMEGTKDAFGRNLNNMEFIWRP